VSGTFYLTTPIYYVNALPHLGHAYTTIAADTMARYRRLAGDDVWFLTGTDEHGDRIAEIAAAAGVAPLAYADRISAQFRQTWDRLGIRYDDYIRTTEERHKVVVRSILQTLWDAGEIYLGRYGGHYCFGCERFYTEKEIVDGKCPDHLTPLTWIEEENYFFKMSKYQGWLIDHITRHPDFIRPERYRNEILGFLRDPLQDLSISRPRTRLEWGIPLPFDDAYVTYVWFDALINYVSALGGPGDPRFERYWPVAEHLIGKDILKPHAVYWPCMLHAAGLPLYRRLDVHAYWTVEGHKMSKSLGNVIEPVGFAAEYGAVGNDAFRYFVLREMTFGLDSDFARDAFVTRLNADLANDLGNLVSRATTLVANFAPGAGAPGPATAEEATLTAAAAHARRALDEAMGEFAFQRGLAAVWEFIGAANRYVDTTQPWALAKKPAERPRLDRVLLTLAEVVRYLGIVLDPFVPTAAARIRGVVGTDGTPRLSEATIGGVTALPAVQKLSGLFPRTDQDKSRTRAAGAGATPSSNSPPTQQSGLAGPATTGPGTAELATRLDFGKIDLRVAEVLAAEALPKSRKLLKLTVSLGGEPRTIVAGIAQHYAPADLVGKKVVVVANLEPATLMGVQSQGMVLAGSTDGDGVLAVLTLDRDLPPGAKVR
jgi:methionyl-tRNA synthetase